MYKTKNHKIGVVPFIIMGVGVIPITTLTYENIIWGSVIILFGIIVLASYSGFEMDKKRHLFRTYFNIAGITFGEWVRYPNIYFLLIAEVKVSTAKFSAAQAKFAQAPSDKRRYSVFLTVDDPEVKHIKLMSSKREQEAYDFTLKLAEYLQTPVLDQTRPEAKWIRK